MNYCYTLTTIARTASEEFRYVCTRIRLAARFVWSVVSHPIAIRLYRSIGHALLNTLIFTAAVLWLAKVKLDRLVEFCEQPPADEPIDMVESVIDAAVTVAAIAWCAAEFGWKATKPLRVRAIELAESAIEVAAFAAVAFAVMSESGLK